MFTTYRHGSSIVLVLKIIRNYKVSTRRHYKLRLIALKKELRTNRLRAMWAFCRTSVKGDMFLQHPKHISILRQRTDKA